MPDQPVDQGPDAAGSGGWWGLADILSDSVQLRADELSRPPEACPDCGEPLRTGPEGELYCAFDGTQWEAGNRRVPRTRPTHN